MSHFAKVENGIVTQVIVAEQDFINSGAVGDSFLWVQTSYNNSFRKNFAGVGDEYDSINDRFMPPQPFNSWTVNTETFSYEPPVPYPTDDLMYKWNEETQSWDEESQP